MTEPQWPEWLTVGAKVAEQGLGRHDNFRFLTVERFTATQCVLSSGDRYRLDNVRQGRPSRHSGGTWGITWNLYPANDPRIVEAGKRNRVRALAIDVDHLMHALKKDPTNIKAAEQAIAKLQQITNQENR